MSQRKSGVFLSYLNIILKNLSAFLYTPFLIRYLGQTNYGLYQMTTSIMTMLFVLHLGFSAAYIRFYSKELEQHGQEGVNRLNGVYMLLFCVLGIVAIILGTILTQNISSVFGKNFTAEELSVTKNLMWLLIINVALTFPSVVFDCYISAKEEFKFLKSREVLLTLSVPLATIPFLLTGCDTTTVVAVQVIITAIFLLLNVQYAYFKLGMRFILKGINFSIFKAIFVFSSFIFINQLVDLINWNLPNFVLGVLAGTKDVSIYGVANQIKNVFVSISTAISAVYIPRIYQIRSEPDSNKKLSELMNKLGKYQFIVVSYIFGGFLLVGPFFINLWVGEKYQSAYVLSILLVVPLIIPLIQNIGMEIIRMKNRYKTVSYVYLIFAICNIAISVIFTKAFGLVGSVMGTFITMILANGVFANFYYKNKIGLDINSFWKTILKISIAPFGSVVILMIVKRFWPIDSIVSFMEYGILYTIIFLIVLALTRLNKLKN